MHCILFGFVEGATLCVALLAGHAPTCCGASHGPGKKPRQTAPFPLPPPAQVKECLRLAAKGQAYNPGGGGGDAAAAGGDGNTAAERGQRQEQQLHEDEAALAAAEAGGGEEGGEASPEDRLLDEGRLLGDGAAGGGGGSRRKRIDGGMAVGGEAPAAHLGLFGVLLWAGALGVAFFMLPWAHRSMRRAAAASPFRPLKGTRSD